MEERTSSGSWSAATPVRRRMRPLIWADPQATIGEAAALLAGDHSCVVVRLPAGVGIATDHDFRRSLADRTLSRSAPLRTICSVPVVTVTEHTDGPAALLEMVERGIHHLVVTTDMGDPVGVVRLVDLASADVRDPLLVRRLLHQARDLDDLVEAAGILPSTVLDLAQIGTPALQVTGIASAVRDLVVRRAVELTDTFEATTVSWLVLGSSARREALPDSDVDTALAWPDPVNGREAEVREGAGHVLEALERCGLSRCPDGANATEPLFSRSVEEWADATRRWIRHPESTGALLLASIAADNRPVTNVEVGRAITQTMLTAARDRRFLGALLSFTLDVKPVRGRVRELTVDHTEAHRGQLDLKRRGLWPVVLLGRWMALVIGDARGSTVDRIRGGSQAGILTAGEAEDLVGAFQQLFQVRFDLEVAALRARDPDDSSGGGSGALDSLQQHYVRDSLRAISSIQTAVRRAWASGQVTRVHPQ